MSFFRRPMQFVNLSLANKILTISMNRAKANAMSTEFLTELTESFDEASKNAEISGVLLRSDLPTTFSAGVDLETMYNLSRTENRTEIDRFIFHDLSLGLMAPLRCSKPVACSLNGHTVAGGLMIALASDFISIGTKKAFRIGITGPLVGIPYPLKALRIAQHQLDAQFAYRVLVDAQLFSSTDFPIRCDRTEDPDQSARKWLQMVVERPLEAFQITKRKWWSDFVRLESIDEQEEKNEYFRAVTSRSSLQAMEKALFKDKK